MQSCSKRHLLNQTSTAYCQDVLHKVMYADDKLHNCLFFQLMIVLDLLFQLKIPDLCPFDGSVAAYLPWGGNSCELWAHLPSPLTWLPAALADLSPSQDRTNQLAKYRDPNNLQECHAVLSPSSPHLLFLPPSPLCPPPPQAPLSPQNCLLELVSGNS